MKKILCFAALLGLINHASAQNTFTNSGSNVGIGTTTPGAKLEVAGTGSSFFLDNDQLSSNRNPLTGAALDVSKGSASMVMSTTSNGGNFKFFTNSVTGGQVLERMRITESGNVGIGTIAPAAKLTSFSTTEQLRLAYDATRYTSLTTSAGGSFSIAPNGLDVATFTSMDFPGLTTATGQIRLFRNSNTTGALGLAIYAGNGTGTNNTYLSANGASYLNANAGNVGIGTTDLPAGYKLAVNGSVIATSVTVKVKNDWPDYVFKKEYKLPTLTEVKDYIDLYHHLPEMPSEKEIIANGLNLGEMNKMLTKKVEELTLYLIQLKGENEKLRKENEIRFKAIEKQFNLTGKKH